MEGLEEDEKGCSRGEDDVRVAEDARDEDGTVGEGMRSKAHAGFFYTGTSTLLNKLPRGGASPRRQRVSSVALCVLAEGRSWRWQWRQEDGCFLTGIGGSKKSTLDATKTTVKSAALKYWSQKCLETQNKC